MNPTYARFVIDSLPKLKAQLDTIEDRPEHAESVLLLREVIAKMEIDAMLHGLEVPPTYNH
jgi:hypothetical protein